MSKGEADVRLIGQLVKRDDGFQERHRPIKPGISVGHFRITAGTIGCIVERGTKTFVLSNNHVLADENAGKPGDWVEHAGGVPGRHGAGDAERGERLHVVDHRRLDVGHGLVDEARFRGGPRILLVTTAGGQAAGKGGEGEVIPPPRRTAFASRR